MKYVFATIISISLLSSPVFADDVSMFIPLQAVRETEDNTPPTVDKVAPTQNVVQAEAEAPPTPPPHSNHPAEKK